MKRATWSSRTRGTRRDCGNWRNAIRHYTEIERFLAGCLGGRRSAS